MKGAWPVLMRASYSPVADVDAGPSVFRGGMKNDSTLPAHESRYSSKATSASATGAPFVVVTLPTTVAEVVHRSQPGSAGESHAISSAASAQGVRRIGAE